MWKPEPIWRISRFKKEMVRTSEMSDPKDGFLLALREEKIVRKIYYERNDALNGASRQLQASRSFSSCFSVCSNPEGTSEQHPCNGANGLMRPSLTAGMKRRTTGEQIVLRREGGKGSVRSRSHRPSQFLLQFGDGRS